MELESKVVMLLFAHNFVSSLVREHTIEFIHRELIEVKVANDIWRL